MTLKMVIDFDNCIANTVRAMYVKYGAPAVIPIDQLLDDPIPTMWPTIPLPPAVSEAMRAFVRSFEGYDGFESFANQLRSGINITVVSERPVELQATLRDWLWIQGTYFGDNVFCFGSLADKISFIRAGGYNYCMDDSVLCCNSCMDKVDRTFLFSQPWNLLTAEHERVYGWMHLAEILGLVHGSVFGRTQR